MSRLQFLLKQANVTTLDSIYDESVARLPKTPEAHTVKLTNHKGKKRPAFIHKRETHSPYNPN